MTGRSGLAVIAVAGLLPWVVVFGERGSMTLVFAFGLLNPDAVHLTWLWSYLTTLTRGVPQSLLAWPVATLLWVGALGSGLAGVATNREDRRVTGGLLVLAGGSLLPVALTVGRPASITAVPVGTVLLWAIGWWRYGDALRRIPAGRRVAER
ncbi:MAG: TIGR04206 family protein [Halobacteriales archaeon]